MRLAERFDTKRCTVERATVGHLEAVTEVFAENAGLLEQTGPFSDVRALAEDAIFNKTLPPGGNLAQACTFVILLKGTASCVGVLECYAGFPTDICLYISRLYLRPSFQRRGIGAEIVSELEALVSKTGMSEARLAINVPNWKALWFWGRIGYTEISGLHGSPETGAGTLELRKRLS